MTESVSLRDMVIELAWQHHSDNSYNYDMTIHEAQQRVDEWIRSVGKGYFSQLTNMALLTEEVGELARVIARIYGEQVPKRTDFSKGNLHQQLSEEMADVLWVLICLANQGGVNLTEALEDSFVKKTQRDTGRWDTRE